MFHAKTIEFAESRDILATSALIFAPLREINC